MIYYDTFGLAMYPFCFFLGLAFILIIAHLLFGPTKSKQYRRELADMYVVGKIKKFAEEEKIDISEELKHFAKSMKVRRINDQYLDNTIEESIKSRIATDTNEKIKSKEK